MRVQRLKLINFRAHEQADFAFDKHNFLLGPNASGKSSVAESICWLLTGFVPERTDEAGKQADSLISRGTAKMVVRATLERNGEQLIVTRTKTAKQHTLELEPSQTAMGGVDLVEAKLHEWLKTNSDVLRAVLSASRFLDMDSKAQKQLLQQVLRQKAIVMPADIAALVQEFISAEGSPQRQVDSLEQLDRYHHLFFNERTVCGRLIKSLGELGPEPEKPDGMPELADVEKQLRDLRQELSRLSAEKGKLEGRATGSRQRLADLEAEEKQHQANVMTPKAIAKLEEGIKADREARRECERKADLAATQLASHRQTRKTIAGLGPVCPTCRSELDAARKKTVIDALDAQIRQLEADGHNAETALGRLFAPLELEAAQRRVEAAKLANERLKAVSTELAALRRDSAENPEFTEKKGLLLNAIKALEDRITKGEAIRSQVQEAHQKIAAWESRKKQIAGLEAKHAKLERLCEWFGPSGVRTEVIGGGLGPFLEVLNERLAAFGFKAEFQLEPWTARVNGFDLRQLSASEKFRFGIAFQTALASATNLKFAVIDGADVLDVDRRAELVEMLMASDLEQAIVCSTSTDAPPDETPEGVRFFVLGGVPKEASA